MISAKMDTLHPYSGKAREDVSPETFKNLKKKRPFKVGELVTDEKSEHKGFIYAGYFKIIENPQCHVEDHRVIKDRNNDVLHHHVFVAPQDLLGEDGAPMSLSFNEAAENIAAIENFMGRNGIKIENQKDFVKLVENGQYNGELRMLTLNEGLKVIGNKNRAFLDSFNDGGLYPTMTNFQCETEHRENKNKHLALSSEAAVYPTVEIAKDSETHLQKPLNYRVGYSVPSIF